MLSEHGAWSAGHALCHGRFPGIHAGPHLLIAGFCHSCFPCRIAQLLWHPSREQREWQLCSAFVGGVGTCSQLFRASIKAGKPWLLVVLTGAEHNELGSVCKGTPGWLSPPRDPKGEMGRGKGQSSGCWCQAGTWGCVKGSPAPGGAEGDAWEWRRCQQILALGPLFTGYVLS